MDNQNLNVLDEINKGATMGMDAISFISQKVEDNQFKNILKTEYNKYKDITKCYKTQDVVMYCCKKPLEIDDFLS